MHYAIAHVVGSGRPDDPFRPPTDQHFSSIDLRPSASGRAGHLLVATPERESGVGTYLGTDAEELSPAVARVLAQRLGVTLDADPTLAELVAELLLVHARTDGTRWRPLRPRRGAVSDRWSIHLGTTIWARQVPALRGAASYTESFNKANSSTVGPDLVWVEQDGLWSVASNALSLPSGSDGSIFADAPLATDDHWVEVTKSAGGADFGGPTVRNRYPESGGRNHYIYDAKTTTNTHRLMKRVNDALSTIAADNLSVDLPLRMHLEADGSSLLGYVGTTTLSATDTSLAGTSYLRGGVAVQAASVTNTFDNWAAADLQALLSLGGSTAPGGTVTKVVPKVLGGSTTPSGVLSQFQRIIVRIFTGSLGGDPAATGTTQYPITDAITDAITAYNPGGAIGGALVRTVVKAFDGTTTPTAERVRAWRKVLGGAVAPGATLARTGIRALAGSITPAGAVTLRTLGRVFGSPGVVAIAVRITGEVRARVRRG